MRRNDDVFFFTLIDFLVQVFFFGLLFYVAAQVVDQPGAPDPKMSNPKAAQSVATWAGFSTITELDDYLGRLAPPVDFRGWADFMSRAKSRDAVEKAMKVVGDAGGVAAVERALADAEKIYGKPSCLPWDRTGKPPTIAVFQVSDTTITLQRGSQELDHLMKELGIQLEGGTALSLGEFNARFAPVKAKGRKCRYYVEVDVKTQLLAPMRTLWSVFAQR